MKIRTITYFLDPDWPINNNALQKAGEFNAAAHTAFEALGYEIQTSRLATIPFPYLLPLVDADNLIKLAQDLEITANAFGFQYLSLGPALPEGLENFDLIPAVLKATKNVFLTGLMSTQNGDISLPAVHQCAEIIQQAASITLDGFSALYIAEPRTRIFAPSLTTCPAVCVFIPPSTSISILCMSPDMFL